MRFNTPDTMTSPRVVLDTNCLVSAMIFNGVLSSKFRPLWINRQIIPVICPETERELREVLAYPKFLLSNVAQDILLRELLDFAEYFPEISPVESIEGLSDTKDTKFIRLAQKANTDFLISGDKHILNLRDRLPELHIVSPAQFFNMNNT